MSGAIAAGPVGARAAREANQHSASALGHVDAITGEKAPGWTLRPTREPVLRNTLESENHSTPKTPSFSPPLPDQSFAQHSGLVKRSEVPRAAAARLGYRFDLAEFCEASLEEVG